MRTYKTEGIILKRTNFGEADKILTIYTRHFGKIKVLAKGVRKTTSRKSGHLELFNWAQIYLAKGRNLDIITEAETVRSFRGWRKNLAKVGLAYYFCELVERLTAENVKNQEIFNLLCGGLLGLGRARASDLAQASQNFAQKLLEETGFWPRGKSTDNLNLEEYIESLIEKKLRAKNIFNLYE